MKNVLPDRPVVKCTLNRRDVTLSIDLRELLSFDADTHCWRGWPENLAHFWWAADGALSSVWRAIRRFQRAAGVCLYPLTQGSHPGGILRRSFSILYKYTHSTFHHTGIFSGERFFLSKIASINGILSCSPITWWKYHEVI